MYDTNERVAQVKERAMRIRRKKEKRAIRGLSTLCLALCCCLVGVLGEVSGGFSSAAEVQGMTGATLLSESAGGYVGTMEPGNVANVVGGTELLGGLVKINSDLLTVLQSFVPVVRNSETTK